MKRAILILVMMLLATTSYNQSSRRTTNTNSNANRDRQRVANNSHSTTYKSRRTSENNRNFEANESKNRFNRVQSRTDTPTNLADNHRSVSRTTTYGRSGTATRKHNGDHSQSYYRNQSNKVVVNQKTASKAVSNYSPRKYRGTHKARGTYYYHKPYGHKTRHYVYRTPVHVDIIWTRDMHYRYARLYPNYTNWYINYGFRIKTIPAYDARYYLGDVMRVYGKVEEVYYHHETDEYFLYFGAYYPYHDFTIVLPGYIARRYSHRPAFYFENQYITVTGLITSFEGETEIVVRSDSQFALY